MSHPELVSIIFWGSLFLYTELDILNVFSMGLCEYVHVCAHGCVCTWVVCTWLCVHMGVYVCMCVCMHLLMQVSMHCGGVHVGSQDDFMQ